MNQLVHEESTGRIIACAIEVHKSLGPGFLESIYEAAMVVELSRAGLKAEQQKPL
jgi:GxxExxY protein